MINYDENLLSKEDLGNLLGKRIKEIRSKINISQAELARRCGKDKQHIALIENNKISPNIYTIYLISYSLEISLSELLNFDALQVKIGK